MDLSIIIPTLNESACIEGTIKTTRTRLSGEYEVEIILVDAGSTDQTLTIAENLVDQCIKNSKFKGAKNKSLNRGGQLAKGKTLFFLDADCVVPMHFDKSIMTVLSSDKVVGGVFEFQMNERGFSYAIIELINRIRYRLYADYFGDQGLFCTKDVFDQLGGFPDQPIMEAAYMCRLLRKKGKLKLAKPKLISSVRRFENGGKWTVFFKDAIIWIQFLLGMNIKRYAEAYWAENDDSNN